ncbi:MAG: nitroreductase family protein [Bacteroidota bacterium]
MNKKANTDYPILETISNRWSPRSFREDEIPNEKIRSLFEAARWASSGFNDQPWRYMVGSKGSTSWNNLLDCLVEGNRDWAKKAPFLILVCAETISKTTGKFSTYATFDAGQSLALLCIQATELGLYTHPMAGFHKDKAISLFHLPSTVEPIVILAVGYKDSPDLLPENLKNLEVSPRQRKNFNEFVFTDKFNQPSEIF